MAGYVPGAKKLSERRSLSRVSLPVLTEFMPTVAVAADWSGSSAVMIWASNVSNRPRTLLTIMWRATKPMCEWTGSRSQVPAT